MRERGWSDRDVADIVSAPLAVDRDTRGNPRYLGTIRGQTVRVVLALDDPDLVVTIHRRRK